jgi:predicted TPR repeat methyltransferase
VTKNLTKFIKYDSDAFYKRSINRIIINKDRTFKIIKKNTIKFKNILEIGCQDGHREIIYKSLNKNIKYYGVDVSKKAIKIGKSYNRNIFNLSSLKIDKLNKKFDLIVLGFILYLMNREDIFKQMDVIYKCLSPNGHLIIQDFESNITHYNQYRNYKKIFTYKTNYSNLLKSSNLFLLIDKKIYVPRKKKEEKFKYNNRSISLYKKIIFEKFFPKNL